MPSVLFEMFVPHAPRVLPTLFVLLLVMAAVSARADADDSTPSIPPDARVTASVSDPIPLWNGVAPGDTGNIGAEKESPASGAPVTPPGDQFLKLENVSRPTITIYRPAREKATGGAVIVCPGGGYYIMAIDLEGTDVCRWLNSIGVTAVLLRYRVPVRAGRERYAAPLQDAQRAIGIVRHRAAEWGIDPQRIGILGFSAGGHLSAALSTNYSARSYPAVDGADQESCRPNATLLIYPAYLTTEQDATRLAPEIKVTAQTPPAFIVQAEDDTDHIKNAFTYSAALTHANVPVELHIYAKGGHGYGMRPSPNPVSHWNRLAETWLAGQGFLTRSETAHP